MIIIKLWGGLGNQLFQYAFGYSLAKEHNDELALDLSFYANQPGNVGKRSIDLDKMCIPAYKKYEPGTVIRILNNKYIGVITRNMPHCELKIGSDMKYFKEPIHKYVEKLPVFGDIYYDGYWQSARYFDKYRKDILDMFAAADGYSSDVENLAAEMRKNNSVAVHMRKGDFGNGTIRKVGHPLGADYYGSAVSYMRKHSEQPVFYVFSDDNEWAKRMIGDGQDIQFVADLCKTNALDDMYLMSRCKNGIMSASTFSWWGNWLREESGTVIVPKGEFYNNFFYEDEWIRI